MKAMIFAAGLGTRLKPLTDHMPKALVPVNGRPMLEHVILKLKQSGFNELVINIHHFGEQIIDFLEANQNFGLTIHISDEREQLLDTGGGIKKAAPFFQGNEPFLIHNVDILSDTDLKALYEYHLHSGNDATLLASKRTTARYLLFDLSDRLERQPQSLPLRAEVAQVSQAYLDRLAGSQRSPGLTRTLTRPNWPEPPDCFLWV